MLVRALILGGSICLSIKKCCRVLMVVFVPLLMMSNAHAQALNYKTSVPISLPSAVVISSDGKFTYVAKDFNLDPAIIEMYARDMATGALTLRQTYQNNADSISGLINPWALTLSPDQTRLYVVNQVSREDKTQSDTLVVFKRDLATGMLTFVETHANNSNGVSGMAAPVSVSVSPDGAHVYVAALDDHAITLFARNLSGDGLTFVESYKNGVGNVSALQQPMSAVVSPDGAQLYIAAAQSGAVVTFARDAATGKLQWQQALLDGANGVDGLAGAFSVVASADGKFIYVAGLAEDAIAVLTRDDQTGTLSAAGLVKNTVNGVAGLTAVSALAMSTDDSRLYAVSPLDSTLTVFQRDPTTGALTLPEAHIDNMKDVNGLEGVFALAASSDGAHVYTLSRENKLGIFQVTVPGQNNVPIARDDIAVTRVGQSVIINVLNNDVDADDDAIVVQSWDTSSLNKGTVEKLTDGTLRYTPTSVYTGRDTFNYTIVDGQGATGTAQVTVIVNTPPVAVSDDVATPKDSAITIWVTANDTDVNAGDVLGVVEVDPVSAQGGKLEIIYGGQDVTEPPQYVTYIPAPEFTGVDTFNYTIADTNGARSSALVTVTVNGAITGLGDGPGIDMNPKTKKGGGSVELWQLLGLIGCIACARSRRRAA